MPRATQARAEALEAATAIVEAVRTSGESALREQASRFDGVSGHAIRVPAEHVAEAAASVDPRVRDALEAAIDRVRRGSAAQVPGPQTTDIGPGAKTTMALIAAEELGVPLDQVDVVWGDTDRCPYSVGESGSRTTIMTGYAVVEAARDLKRQIAERGAPGTSEVLIASATPNPSTQGRQRLCFAAHFCELEVDVQLGSVRITKFVAVHESGRILNPLPARDQILGEIFRRMSEHFRADAAGDTEAVIHWRIGGGPGGDTSDYETVIGNGACAIHEGLQSEKARVTFKIDGADFLRLVTGNAAGPMLFMSGKLQIEGDMMFAANAAMEFEAELLVHDAERKAELLRQADRYEAEGLHAVAAQLRQRADALSLDRPLAAVLPSLAHWQASEPTPNLLSQPESTESLGLPLDRSPERSSQPTAADNGRKKARRSFQFSKR